MTEEERPNGPILIQVVERSLELGERMHPVQKLGPGDSLFVIDEGVREGGPSPVLLQYLVHGVLQLVVVTEKKAP